MTRVDNNTQILADAYCGANRTPMESNPGRFTANELGTEILMNSAWIGIPAIASPFVSPYWNAFSKWRKNEPMCETFSKAYDRVINERNLLNRPVAQYKTNYANRTLFSHMDAMWKKFPELQDLEDISKLSKGKQTKLANKKLINEQLKEVRKLLDDVKLGKVPASELKAHYGKIIEKLQQADIKINELRWNGRIQPTSMFGKGMHALKKGTGYYKAKDFMLKSPKGFKFLKSVGKFGKMSGGFAAVGAVLGEAGDVMGAREIDKIEQKHGINNHRMAKQIGQSTVIAGASVAGSIAAASAAGAAVGTAVCPVVGTIIGLAAGAIGGFVAGWLAKKATGPSQVEEFQKEQQAQANKAADELAKEASGNKEVKDQLLTALKQQKIDDKEILAILEEEVKARQTEINETNELSEQLLNLGNINYAA